MDWGDWRRALGRRRWGLGLRRRARSGLLAAGTGGRRMRGALAARRRLWLRRQAGRHRKAGLGRRLCLLALLGRQAAGRRWRQVLGMRLRQAGGRLPRRRQVLGLWLGQALRLCPCPWVLCRQPFRRRCRPLSRRRCPLLSRRLYRRRGPRPQRRRLFPTRCSPNRGGRVRAMSRATGGR